MQNEIRRVLLFVTILSVVAIFTARQDLPRVGPLLPVFPTLAQPFFSQARAETLQDTATIKLGTELVSISVAVTDKSGRMIEGLRKEDFRIYEDKIEQPISFFSEEDTPVSVDIVLDTSGSMSDNKILQAREAVARFVQTSHDQDEYSLISFNESAQLLMDRTHNSEALLTRIANIKPDGNTALYDAVSLGIETAPHSSYARRAMILVSDGEDNHSRVTFNQLRRRLQEASLTIYTIQIGLPLPHGIGRMVLGQLAAVSGGRMFSPKNEEGMSEAFVQIALELRRRYSIGYLASGFVPDGRWHQIKVNVLAPRDSPKPVVRSREGYYAIRNQADSRNNLGRGGRETESFERKDSP
jgi:Ca-activated chloride channel family protein